MAVDHMSENQGETCCKSVNFRSKSNYVHEFVIRFFWNSCRRGSRGGARGGYQDYNRNGRPDSGYDRGTSVGSRDAKV